MTDYQFSVHKSMVLSNRKALVLYLFKINRSHDVSSIMEQVIDLNEITGSRVPLKMVTDEINLLSHLLQEDYLGLKVIDLIDVKFLPLYKGIGLCIDPLLKSEIEIPFVLLCRLVAGYFKVITESIQVDLVEEKGLIRLDFSPSMPDHVSKHQIDGVILAVHKILYTFSSLRPTRLTISYRQPSYDIDIYKELFGVRVELESTKNSLYYTLKPNHSFQPSAVSIDEIKELLKDTSFITPLHNMLDKEFSGSSYSEHCQHILTTIMGLNEPTREQVAQIMNMSVSSLQRRLREEKTSFKEILLTTRKMMADKYLIEQELPVTDTAFLLGYQSTSHFFKVFKDWYSMTPMTYQKLHRKDKPSTG